MISVKSINRALNAIRYQSDGAGKDVWKTPNEFKKNGGDCEDYAIAKYFELKKRGHSIKNTSIAYCELKRHDRNNPEAHMVLIHNGKVLDNITNKISPIHVRKDLRIIYTFDENRVYLNGKSNPNNLRKWEDLIERMERE